MVPNYPKMQTLNHLLFTLEQSKSQQMVHRIEALRIIVTYSSEYSRGTQWPIWEKHFSVTPSR